MNKKTKNIWIPVGIITIIIIAVFVLIKIECPDMSDNMVVGIRELKSLMLIMVLIILLRILCYQPE